mgnify:CR=1 FL=1
MSDDENPDEILISTEDLEFLQDQIKLLGSENNSLKDQISQANNLDDKIEAIYLKEKGVKIPKEFAVVGFSNEPFTKFMELSISTIDQSPLEMGRMAAKVFLEQVENNDVKIEKKVVLEPKLIIRDSSFRKKAKN